MTRHSHGSRWSMVAALACVGVVACDTSSGVPVLRGGHEEWFLSTIREAAAATDCRGLAVSGIRLADDRAEVALAHDGGGSSVRMRHPSFRCRHCLLSERFAIEHDPGDPCGTAFAAALHRSVERSDPPEVWAFVGKPPFVTGDGLWLFLGGWGALVLVAAALGMRHVRWDLVVIAAGALGLRLLLATWGPGDLQLNLHADKAQVYGAAPYAVAWGLDRLLRPDDLVPLLVWASAVLGSAAVLLTFVFLREAGASRGIAGAAAALLAAHPLAIRFSGDCERQMYLLVAQVAALAAVAAAVKRDRWWPLAGLVLAGTLATFTRPEGFAVWLASAWLALLLPPSPRGWAAFGIGLAGAGIGLWRMLQGFGEQAVAAPVRFEPGGLMLGDPAVTPVVVIIAFAAGCILAARDRDRLFLGMAVLAVTASLPGLIHSGAGVHLANARYQLQSIIPLVAVAAFGLVGLLHRAGSRRPSRWWPAVAWLLVALSSVPPIVRVNRPVTIDRELAFLRASLPRLPRNAVVFVSHPDGRVMDVAGFRSMDAVADWVGRPDLQWRLWEAGREIEEGNAFFYRQPACDLPENRPGDAPPGAPRHECLPCVVARCREAMAHAMPAAVAEVTVPARPFGPEAFVSSRITLGLYPLRSAPR